MSFDFMVLPDALADGSSEVFALHAPTKTNINSKSHILSAFIRSSISKNTRVAYPMRIHDLHDETCKRYPISYDTEHLSGLGHLWIRLSTLLLQLY